MGDASPKGEGFDTLSYYEGSYLCTDGTMPYLSAKGRMPYLSMEGTMNYLSTEGKMPYFLTEGECLSYGGNDALSY